MHKWAAALLFLSFANPGFAAVSIPGPAEPVALQSTQKEIKDPAEYNAYMSAYNMTDAAAKGAAMEAFAAQYPQSVVRIDALEQGMAAYQQAGNVQKLEQIARRLVDADFDNVRPVAILTVLLRSQSTQSGDISKLTDICSFSQRGTTFLATWSKPENLSDAGFTALRNQMAEIFYGGSGYCGLKQKTYNYARDNYLKALQINPSDLSNNFELATAELENDPMELNGFWYLAKAVRLAQGQHNADAVKSVADYGKGKYRRYHGGEDGWEKLLASAGDGNSPPSSFAGSIKKALSEAEQACNAVRDHEPFDLSFDDWEVVFTHRDDSPCNLEAANKVWAAIQKRQEHGRAKLRFEGKVISSSRNSLGVAITDDHQTSGEIDMEIMMEKPLANPPARGTMVNVIGVITRYTPHPFFFEMEEGEFSVIGAGTKVNRP